MTSVLASRIDSEGFFIEDLFVEDGRIPDNVIRTPVPSGFYRPRWDGMRWIEGLTPQEILNQSVRPSPDWQALITLMGSRPEALAILSMTSNAIALICLIVEVHSERARYDQLKRFWDAVIDSIQYPIPPEFKISIDRILVECHIPLSIDDNLHLTIPQNHEAGSD